MTIPLPIYVFDLLYFYFQNEARKLNHKEVVAEDERKNRPANWEQKRKRVDWEEEAEMKKKVFILNHISNNLSFLD